MSKWCSNTDAALMLFQFLFDYFHDLMENRGSSLSHVISSQTSADKVKHTDVSAVLVCVQVQWGGFFLICQDNGERFDESLPTCIFLYPPPLTPVTEFRGVYWNCCVCLSRCLMFPCVCVTDCVSGFCLDDIFLTVHSFVTKLGMVVHHHQLECHVCVCLCLLTFLIP